MAQHESDPCISALLGHGSSQAADLRRIFADHGILPGKTRSWATPSLIVDSSKTNIDNVAIDEEEFECYLLMKGLEKLKKMIEVERSMLIELRQVKALVKEQKRDDDGDGVGL